MLAKQKKMRKNKTKMEDKSGEGEGAAKKDIQKKRRNLRLQRPIPSHPIVDRTALPYTMLTQHLSRPRATVARGKKKKLKDVISSLDSCISQGEAAKERERVSWW